MLRTAPFYIRLPVALALIALFALLGRWVIRKYFPAADKKPPLPPLLILAAALLYFWAAVDLYHYLIIGQDLVTRYDGLYTIRKLVNNSLLQAIAKMLFADVLIIGGWKSRGRKSFRSKTAIAFLLIASIMGTWLVSMVNLTLVTAQEMYDELYEQSRNYPTSVSRFGILHEFYEGEYSRKGYQYERPDFFEYQILRSIGSTLSAAYHTGGHYDSYDPQTGAERRKLIRDISYPLETAALIYDAEGNLLHSSENDAMYFDYFTQEEWDAGEDTTSGLHYGWIDLSEGKDAENWQDDPYLRFRTMYSGVHHLFDIDAIRVEGYFEGTKLVPVVMHYVTETQVWDVVENDKQFSDGPGSYRYLMSDVDRTGKLDWQLQFDRSAEYEGKELTTVYLSHPYMWSYEGEPLVYNDLEYENLADLTEELDFPLEERRYYDDRSISKLNELLIFGRWIGADFSTEEYLKTGEYKVDFYLVTAVRSNPLACAMSALRNIYIVTGLLALAMFLVVYSNIKTRLVEPLISTTAAMANDWGPYWLENTAAMWQETEKLREVYVAERDHRRMKDNEIQRLNTALAYAKTAEQNRRQMTSHIAHELKTPIAIIHSYAEGLKEHIAEDKREKYIDVILSEAERTDSMVLEMLDLSRLEAGKVKLSRDEFDLAALIKGVFEKLHMAAQAKELKISFDMPEECRITADETRMAQVIENFATNAIKYTPHGGQIFVRIPEGQLKTAVFIENDSEPLSPEALSKVWDTFYRTDEARSGGGTGLGLAIAKSIIELHGGKCYVRNTRRGVEFSFSL